MGGLPAPLFAITARPRATATADADTFTTEQAHPSPVMERVSLADQDHAASNSPADVVLPLSDALGTETLACNYFELAPGESFGFDYHCHHDQEEVFYVQSGTATFRTEDGDVEVGTGELVRFAPGEFQLGRNEGTDRVVALALGAPRDSRDIEYLRDCPECDEETRQRPELAEETRTLSIRCTDCETVVDEFSL
jgi:uncharacterized cupin superfamily protein